MKNRKITLACLMALGALAIASCKKKTDESVHDRLVGKWKTELVGVDSNGNGAIDASEPQFVPNPSYFTFSGDGSGKVQDSATNATSSTFTWSLKNNDADLVFKITSGGTTDTVHTYHLKMFSSTELSMAIDDSTKLVVDMKKQ